VDKTGTLRLADARNNSILRVISAHSARILDVKFSPDDKQIATSSMDKTVKIWDANNLTNRPITISKHLGWVLSVAFSPDGRHLVSSSESGDYIYVWPTRSSIMAEQMCGKVSRNLTQREWETYISYDIPYQKTCPNK
jgi:WD40 repeat protein